MAHRIGLGVLVGSIVAALMWRGNTTSHVVSVFPDGLTFAVLVFLLFLAVRLELRRAHSSDRRRELQASVTIATSAGVVLGVATLALGFLRFSQPSVALLTSFIAGATRT